MLEKVIARAATPGEAIARMDCALRKHRIRGVPTSLTFLGAVLGRRKFHSNAYTTRFTAEPAPGRRQKLDQLGPQGFAEWMRGERRVLLIDTPCGPRPCRARFRPSPWRRASR